MLYPHRTQKCFIHLERHKHLWRTITTMQTFHLELNAPDFIRDPYPLLETLRHEKPIFYDEPWKKVFFLRYDDIAQLLRDKRLGRSIFHVLSRDELGFPPPDPRLTAFDEFQRHHILDMEPPGHTRIRGLVQKAFTPSRVENLRGRIRHLVASSLENLPPEFDAVRDFAEPLPVTVIAELLGVPEADRHHLRPWSAAIVKLYELGYSDATAKAGNEAVLEFSSYIQHLAQKRRLEPLDDLITALVQVEEAGEKLSNAELVANCILFLNAGHEATVNGMSAALLALHRHSNAKAELVAATAQPDTARIWHTAVEELLRFDTPLPMFERWVLEDFEFGGVQLQKGMELGLLYASGNRDAAKFSQPNEIVLTRDPNQHLTFGLGTHYCIGAPLARLEMGVALRGFLQKFPDYWIPEQPLEYGGFVIRGLRQLLVKANT
jgi:cytochrome P450